MLSNRNLRMEKNGASSFHFCFLSILTVLEQKDILCVFGQNKNLMHHLSNFKASSLLIREVSMAEVTTSIL